MDAFDYPGVSRRDAQVGVPLPALPRQKHAISLLFGLRFPHFPKSFRWLLAVIVRRISKEL
jgi:hypothetical protein